MPDAPRHHPSRDTAPGRPGLGPHVVGVRVVVRHRLPDGSATDVLGTCTAWGERSLVVDREGHGPVEIALADVVTGKPVPPRPSVRHRASPREVQGHVASLWDDLVTEPLGEWVLRVAPPYAGRLRRRGNSVLAMGDPGMPLAEASDRARAFYTARAQRPIAQVVSDGDVDAALLALGWTPLGSGDTHCLLASVPRALRSCNAQLPHLGSRSGGVPDGVTARYKEVGSRLEVTLGEGTARGVAALDGDWVGLHSVEVDPAHRRRGLATRVLAELLDWGASRGATTAWLHVETDNDAAIALYDRLGFVTHHTSRYLVS